MNDRKHDGGRREHGDGHADCRERGPEGGADRPDTRFLQLEMSKVLYGEAECVTREALRALLLEAAKLKLHERFGDQIEALAELAVDDLLADVNASLEVEERIRARTEQRRAGDDRLRAALRRA